MTLTEDRALTAAKVADAEIEAGRWRGPLHGIPYGAKDLLATRGIPTTWGASPFTNQVIDTDAAVIQRLDRAGAILVAKLSLGELAMGDTWFEGKTRNPWKPDQGSSGSSLPERRPPSRRVSSRSRSVRRPLDRLCRRPSSVACRVSGPPLAGFLEPGR